VTRQVAEHRPELTLRNAGDLSRSITNSVPGLTIIITRQYGSREPPDQRRATVGQPLAGNAEQCADYTVQGSQLIKVF